MGRKQLFATLMIMGWRKSTSPYALISPLNWETEYIIDFRLGSYYFKKAGEQAVFMTAKQALEKITEMSKRRIPE